MWMRWDTKALKRTLALSSRAPARERGDALPCGLMEGEVLGAFCLGMDGFCPGKPMDITPLGHPGTACPEPAVGGAGGRDSALAVARGGFCSHI